MPTSVVTGGAGFIGSHLCTRLLKEGHFVICVDNLLTGRYENIKQLMDHKDFRFVKFDVTDYMFVKGDVDFVFHLASVASPIDYLKYPLDTLRVGSLGTERALELAKMKNAKFLLASSSEVYGDPLIHPQPEDYWGNVNPIGIRGVYDESKRYGEALTMAYSRYHDVDTRIVRIFNTYGERMRVNDGRAIPSFITQALRGEDITVFGDGSQTRSVCYISDTVDGIFKLMMSNYKLPMNIGNPTEITMSDLANEIVKLTDSASKIVFRDLPEDDPKVRQPDITLAMTKLKWVPKVSREEGLNRTIQYFKDTINAGV